METTDTNGRNAPQAFDADVYRMLDEFDDLYYFRWDLSSDVLTFASPVGNAPYDFPQLVENASTNLAEKGYLHPGDAHLLALYMNRIFRATVRENKARQNERVTKEIRLKAKGVASDEYLWAELKLVTYYQDGMPARAFGRLRNINEEKLQQLKLAHEAEHDLLTGFLNKTATQREAERYLMSIARMNKESALIIVDADNFKAINDNFGHLFGDAVLTDMAMAIEKNFRRTDIFGRIGGDEFVVLVRDLPSIADLEEHCQQLIGSLTRKYDNDGEELPFSVSIGIARYPEHGKKYAELFAKADRALYESKEKGKGCYSIYKASLLGAASVVSTRDPMHAADIRQRAFKDNMIEFIFQLLYETKNPDATIDLSLGMFGKQFSIDRVAIDRYNKTTNTYVNAYEWLSPRGVSLRNETHSPDLYAHIDSRNQMILSRYKPTPYGVMSLCRDTSKLAEKYQAAAHMFKNAAFAHCKITHGTEDLGCVAFESAVGPRTFTEEELSALSVFAVMLGNVLLGRKTDEALRHENEQLKAILDYMQEMVYVVDKDTYEPVFFNRTIRQAVPENSAKEPCYYRFHSLEGPCPDCPLNYLSADGKEYIIRAATVWGTETNVRAYNNIEWGTPGHRMALIIMEPF